jgi:DNA-binding transcriptional regulator YhcF (GntR family)
VQFFIDKTNKIPLYLQLKDQIKYYISTGALQMQEQLPPFKVLAKDLGINFQTVRQAYQQLANEGLAEIKHGEGTFITLQNLRNQKETSQQNSDENSVAQFTDEFRKLADKFLQNGLDFAEAKNIANKVFDEIECGNSLPTVIFAECNQFQIKEISFLLEKELLIPVKPMLVEELSRKLPDLIGEGKAINVVTTGFHVNEVRNSVRDLPVQIDVLITNLNPKTRRQLESFGEKASYSFICRDRESAVLYKDLLKAELGYQQINLTACTLDETEKVKTILNSSDVVLVSPPVFEEIRKLAPPEKAVFNVFERVDPMSLKVVKDRILGS